jgi:hypothetical protein
MAQRGTVAAGAAALTVLLALLATAASAGPRLVDVSTRAGIFDKTHTWSAEVGDLNRDGWEDLLVVNHYEKPAYLYQNDRHGGFRRVDTGNDTFRRRDRHDCAFGRLNRDRRVDIYCSIGGGRGRKLNPNELWIQRRDGTFANRAGHFGVDDPRGRGRDVALLDVDRDGFLDIYVGNKFPRKDSIRSVNKLFMSVRGRHFRSAPEYHLNRHVGGRTVQTVRYGGDRFPDLLVCGERHAFLFRNLGGRAFRDVSREKGVAARCEGALMTRIDGDRKLDLVIVTESRLEVRLQRKHGSFRGEPVVRRELRQGTAVAAGRVNGDPRSDLYVVQQGPTNHDRPDLLLLNRNGGRRFESLRIPQTRRGRGDYVTSFDYDRNRRSDFVVLNGDHTSRGPVRLLATKR